jgi:hypothetical protein
MYNLSIFVTYSFVILFKFNWLWIYICKLFFNKTKNIEISLIGIFGLFVIFLISSFTHLLISHVYIHN